MSSHKGPLTVDQGADSLVWLAVLPPGDPANPKGDMVAERKVLHPPGVQALSIT